MAVYFSFGACMPRTDFSQLLKLDELSEHYQLHVEEANQVGEEMTLSSFLYLHFIVGDEHQHEGEDHEDLPLQNITSSISMIAAVLEQHTERNIFDAQILHSFFGTSLLKGVSSDIFHPPC
ncbi:MAG: hypothetical protein HKN16_12105 [Saprospiraceae bacterium]|nr:hypothetical protein [Saprospiraceae bacterium]